MQAQYRAMAEKVEEDDRAARRANATALTAASGDPNYVNAVMEQRRKANLMMEDVRDERVSLAKFKASLSAREDGAKSATTILATPTLQTYAGLPVYVTVGRAPH